MLDIMLNAMLEVSSTEKVRALAQFNRVSGVAVAILGYTDPIELNNTDYQYVEIEACLTTDHVRGTIDNFEIYDPSKEEVLEVNELTLDTQAQSKIIKVYPVSRQINIIRKVITELAAKAGLSEEEGTAYNDLLEMNDYIAEVLANNKSRKEFMAESPNFRYVSAAASEELHNKSLEGGLHETYGPRPASLIPGL